MGCLAVNFGISLFLFARLNIDILADHAIYLALVAIIIAWFIIRLKNNTRFANKNLKLLKYQPSELTDVKEYLQGLTMIQEFIEITKKKPESYESKILSGIADTIPDYQQLFSQDSFNLQTSQSPVSKSRRKIPLNQNSIKKRGSVFGPQINSNQFVSRGGRTNSKNVLFLINGAKNENIVTDVDKLVDLLIENYLSIMKIYPNNPLIIISFIYFMIDFTQDLNHLKYQVKILEMMNLSFENQLSLLRIKSILFKANSDGFESGKNQSNLDILNNKGLQNIELITINGRMVSLIENSCQNYSILWQTLADDNPKITKVAEIMETCAEILKNTLDCWENNPALNILNLPVKKTYAQFLSVILDQREKGEKLYVSFFEHIKKQARLKINNPDIKVYSKGLNKNKTTLYDKYIQCNRPIAILRFNPSQKLLIAACNLTFSLKFKTTPKLLKSKLLDCIVNTEQARYLKSRLGSMIHTLNLKKIETGHASLPKSLFCDQINIFLGLNLSSGKMMFNSANFKLIETKNEINVLMTLREDKSDAVQGEFMLDYKGNIMSYSWGVINILKTNQFRDPIFSKYRTVLDIMGQFSCPKSAFLSQKISKNGLMSLLTLQTSRKEGLTIELKQGTKRAVNAIINLEMVRLEGTQSLVLKLRIVGYSELKDFKKDRRKSYLEPIQEDEKSFISTKANQINSEMYSSEYQTYDSFPFNFTVSEQFNMYGSFEKNTQPVGKFRSAQQIAGMALCQQGSKIAVKSNNTVEKIDYGEGIRIRRLFGDDIRDIYELETENSEDGSNNKGGVRLKKQASSLLKKAASRIATINDLDLVKTKPSKTKKKISEAIDSKKGLHKYSKVSFVATVILFTFLICNAELFRIRVKTNSEELKHFGSINFALGLRRYNLGEILSYIQDILNINSGMDLSENYHNPTIDMNQYREESYQRLLRSFKVLDYYDNMIYDNMNKMSNAKELTATSQLMNVTIVREGVEHQYNLRQAVKIIIASSLALTDKDPSTFTIDEPNLNFLLYNANVGILSQMSYEAEVVQPMISSIYDECVLYSNFLMRMLLLGALLIVPIKWILYIKIASYKESIYYTWYFYSDSYMTEMSEKCEQMYLILQEKKMILDNTSEASFVSMEFEEATGELTSLAKEKDDANEDNFFKLRNRKKKGTIARVFKCAYFMMGFYIIGLLAYISLNVFSTVGTVKMFSEYSDVIGKNGAHISGAQAIQNLMTGALNYPLDLFYTWNSFGALVGFSVSSNAAYDRFSSEAMFSISLNANVKTYIIENFLGNVCDHYKTLTNPIEYVPLGFTDCENFHRGILTQVSLQILEKILILNRAFHSQSQNTRIRLTP